MEIKLFLRSRVERACASLQHLGWLSLASVLLLASCASDSAERNGQRAAPTPAERRSVPQAPTPQASPAPQQSRAAVALAAARKKPREEQRDLIASLISDGVFSQIELNEGIPRVYLRPAFNLLTPEDKHLYLATVFAFAFPDGVGPGTATKVVLFDSVSGEETGAFTEAGFQMK